MIIFTRLLIAVCIGGGLSESGLTMVDPMLWYVVIGGNALVFLVSYNKGE